VNNDEKKKVKIGLSDYQKVEILEGLKKETIYTKVNYKLILNIAFHFA
jgi:hypothetical protein